MQSDGEARTPKTSATHFPLKLPADVVDFVLKETYDLVTAQQIMCSKLSPQESANSITPTNSLKILESNQTVKSCHIIDSPLSKSNDEIEAGEKSDLTILDFNTSKQEVQKVMEDVLSDENKRRQLAQNITNKLFGNNEETDEPKVIFNAINFSHQKHDKFLKKKSRTLKSLKTKCNKFKCKAPKNCICNRLEKYYEKTKQNSVKSGVIQQEFSNISIVVSRATILKKVFGKENLEKTEQISITSNESNLNENIDESHSSHASIVENESSIKNSSENTLTRKSSINLSKTQDIHSANNIESVINMSPENTTPFNTEVINVNVTVAYDKTNVETISKTEEFIYLGNLTSTETLCMDLGALTSKYPSDFIKPKNFKKLKSNETNSTVLEMNKKSSFDVSSDDDIYDMARSSSDLNDSNNSTFTLKNNVEDVIHSEKIELEKTDKQKQSLLQTVIDLRYYPEVAPSTSSARVMGIDGNNFKVTKNAKPSYMGEIKNMGDSGNKNEISTNHLKNLLIEKNMPPSVKSINQLKQRQIEELIDSNLHHQKSAEDCNFYPSNLPEIWERLVLIIDVAFKRLEESLTDKIIREMKKTLANLDLKPIPEHDVDLENGDVVEPSSFNEIIPAQNFRQQTNECLQCELIQNNVMDQIMLKLSTVRPKTLEPETSVSALRKLKPKTFRDYFEVLKLPIVAGPDVSTDRGDTVTVCTVNEEVGKFRRLFFGPLHFIRENLLVITSVPAFFVVLLFVYGLLMLAIKPW